MATITLKSRLQCTVQPVSEPHADTLHKETESCDYWHREATLRKQGTATHIELSSAISRLVSYRPWPDTYGPG